jgi:hypothetical protein
MIQTFFNSDGTGLTAIITVIVDGDHVDPDSWPITNDPAIVLSSHPAASKTVTAIDTGVFKVVWSSLSPALAHGDVVFIAVDGAISATAWTTWQIPVQVVWLPATPANVTTALEDMDLDKALIAQGAERAVSVDVNHRVHSHVYDMQANTITASALAADAIEEIQSGLAKTGADGDTLETLSDQIDGISGGGGTATIENQESILAAIQGSEVIQTASPNVQGNLVLTQGDDYDGTANPKAQWTVGVDYTDGWSVAFTIRDAADAVVYTTTGEVVSSTVVAVEIAAPTGLTMSGCPGQWQGKFDVELTKAGKKKTIALGTVYINEDQTR